MHTRDPYRALYPSILSSNPYILNDSMFECFFFVVSRYPFAHTTPKCVHNHCDTNRPFKRVVQRGRGMKQMDNLYGVDYDWNKNRALKYACDSHAVQITSERSLSPIVFVSYRGLEKISWNYEFWSRLCGRAGGGGEDERTKEWSVPLRWRSLKSVLCLFWGAEANGECVWHYSQMRRKRERQNYVKHTTVTDSIWLKRD